MPASACVIRHIVAVQAAMIERTYYKTRGRRLCHQTSRGPAMNPKPRCKSTIVCTVISCILAILSNQAHSATARPLRIAFLFTSGTMASMWMAKETGAFTKEGLDVEMISMSSTLALPALLANEVEAIQISAVPLINASLRGFDPVFVAGIAEHHGLGLV